ncbi:uncharacterized protein LOC111941952 isoform X3 [Cyanistes caeruleus]|uniref:uncharacterized protein LOC111941952 isoform X3 n=1 Tax=Cyanistes caeruleus TaxID=156563 RepID=UPI000CDADD6C|nr:uncharacterized protein LOC111941952 isoform X3 [Cyanistes caeruleus]
MAFPLRLFLLLLLAVALPDRAAQAAPWRAQGADWNHHMDYLEVMNDGLKFLEDVGAKPLGAGDAAPQPTPRTESQGGGEVTGVWAGSALPAPGLLTADKPGSHRRGPPTGRNKATGHKKPREPSNTMQQMLKEMLQGAQEKNQKAVLKAAFPGGSSGSWAASAAAGREAMPGTVPGAEPLGEGDLASHPTPRTEPQGGGEVTGVWAGSALPAPGLLTADKPGSHRRGKNKATGHKKPHEPSNTMQQMLKEMLQGAQAKPLGEGDLASLLTSRTEPHGDGEGVSAGRIFPDTFQDAAHKPSSHHRGRNKATGHKKPHEPSNTMQQMLKEMLQGAQEKDQKAVLKAVFPRENSGSWSASAAGREAMPGTVSEDWDRDMEYMEMLVSGGLKTLPDTGGKFSVSLSAQNNQCQCGKSSLMCHFP